MNTARTKTNDINNNNNNSNDKGQRKINIANQREKGNGKGNEKESENCNGRRWLKWEKQGAAHKGPWCESSSKWILLAGCDDVDGILSSNLDSVIAALLLLKQSE